MRTFIKTTVCNIILGYFIPLSGPFLVVPYGVPIWSLSVIYLPLEKFFGFHFRAGNRPFLTPEIFNCDGWWWWMVVDGGGGGWSKKKFSDFAQNFFRWSSGDINLWKFGKSAKNFFYRKKIQLQFSKSGGFLVEKKVLWFLSKFCQMKLRWYKCAPISFFVTV